MGRFSGRRVWVTGAETPVGAAIARALYDEGAELLLSGTAEPPAGVAARCCPRNPVTDADAATALEGVETLDGLVHAAGHVCPVSIEDCSLEVWEREMDENLMTAWCASRAAVRRIGPHRGGAIVYVSSIHGDKPTGSAFTYSVAQGAVTMLMKEAAQDYGRLGIRVNLVQVGALAGDDARFASDISTIYDNLEEKVPLGPADPAAVTGPVLFLLSEEAAFVNGATLRADGGFLGHYGFGDSQRRWENGNA